MTTLRIVDKWPRVGPCSACDESRAVYRVELRGPAGAWRGQVCRYCGSGMRLALRQLSQVGTVESTGIVSAAAAGAATVGSQNHEGN